MRLALGAIGFWFVSLEENPVVRFEAKIGLSPAPFERFTSLKGPFSGMTEGMHQLTRGNLNQAVAANVLTPVVAAMILLCVLLGRVPRIHTRKGEQWFFATMVAAAILVNAVN